MIVYGKGGGTNVPCEILIKFGFYFFINIDFYMSISINTLFVPKWSKNDRTYENDMSIKRCRHAEFYF